MNSGCVPSCRLLSASQRRSAAAKQTAKTHTFLSPPKRTVFVHLLWKPTFDQWQQGPHCRRSSLENAARCTDGRYGESCTTAWELSVEVGSGPVTPSCRVDDPNFANGASCALPPVETGMANGRSDWRSARAIPREHQEYLGCHAISSQPVALES